MNHKYLQGKYPIIKRGNIAKNCYDFHILCPDIAAIAQPGQFVHVLADGFPLRRPISICGIDKAVGTIRIVFEVRGEGTAVIAAQTQIIDIMAPLGNGFTLLDSSKKAVVIGGGIGAPPMLVLAKHYQNPTAIIGFRSASNAILLDDFSKAANTIVCSDDGTIGRKGFVTSPLKELLEADKPDIIYACGPHPMLKAISTLVETHGVVCEVSLEERMGCGVGACLVCACKSVKNGQEFFAHVCKDGPVFNSKEVVL